MRPVKLTETVKAAGCAAKLSPEILHRVLGNLFIKGNPSVLRGFDTGDDAGIYKLSDDLALVQTVDFFTPIVDDPFLFGQVAAANALSDVYAMSGAPISALSIVGFPPTEDTEILTQVMAGGLSKLEEARCALLGGHSIRDPELKFGYAITGTVHPQKFWTNGGAQPGDILFLTKALGTGLIATAAKRGEVSETAQRGAEQSMVTLNANAADALREIEKRSRRPIQSVTDVTGFGLLGHARGMALASRVSIEIDHQMLPCLPGALDYARSEFVSQGLKNNQEFVSGCVEFDEGISRDYRYLCCDPQTSGGLLVALPESARATAQQVFDEWELSLHWIGKVAEKGTALIRVS